jgi:hypothetical protein
VTAFGWLPWNTELLFEFAAGIDAESGPKWLGNMAKAVHPIAGDVLQPKAGELQMPCVTHNPSRASDYSQAEISGRARRSAGGALVMPCAEKCGSGGVHDLFLAWVAAVLIIGVPCLAAFGSVRVKGHIEFAAGIDAESGPKWLGNMAKAVHPIAGDVLLCTAGL